MDEIIREGAKNPEANDKSFDEYWEWEKDKIKGIIFSKVKIWEIEIRKQDSWKKGNWSFNTGSFTWRILKFKPMFIQAYFSISLSLIHLIFIGVIAVSN